jgi:hypothetical protein
MEIKVGARLRSAVCATEVILVRAPGGEVDLRCGGKPMVNLADGPPGGDPSALDPDFAGGTALGKRYADEEVGLEVLATKGGVGTLSVGTTPLPLKEAKALPASD